MMTDSTFIDTRQVIRNEFEPWMIDRLVEIQVDTGRKWAGYLESYAVTNQEWLWKLRDKPEYSQRRREKDAGYSTYYTPREYSLSIVVIVPNNWDHYGVDGREVAR